MQKILFFTVGLLLSASLSAQTFSDDFESYSEGDYLGVESADWTTWSGNTGGTEDVQITTANASSGSNALYFSSTGAGGPQDVVLPFDQVYNSGNFTFEMNFFVEEDKTAYFNLQGTLTVAEIWAMDCYMYEDGSIVLSNDAGANVYLTTTYPVGQWFNLRVEMDLTANVWELFINNMSEGTFANSTGQIGILDLYPVSLSSFYVDDVSYTYIPAELPAENGGVTFVNPVGGIVGQIETIEGTVRNLGSEDITSFDISYDYNGTQVLESVGPISLASLETYPHTFATAAELVGGNNPLVVTVSNVNGLAVDGDPSDDDKTVSVNPVVPAAGRIVVGEEATGTWCQWCPRGAVWMDIMATKYPNNWAGIAVHNADPMTNDVYDASISAAVSGYPSSLVDRGPDNDPSTMEQSFLQNVTEDPTAIVTNGATYDENTRELNVSFTFDFQEAATGNWKVAYVLTEDGVTGTGAGWAQSNAYAGGGNGEMGGYELLPSPVPASQMVYDHVAREILPSFDGQSNVFPTSIEAGTSHTVCFSNYTLPIGWNADNMHIVGLLIAPNGDINNAGYSDIATAVSNGLEVCSGVGLIEDLKSDGLLNIYPNPTDGVAYIDVIDVTNEQVNITISDISGKVIATRDYTINGTMKLPIQTEALETGIYMVTMTIGDVQGQQRLIVR